MKKSNNIIFETLCSTEAGARLLVDTIIKDYGVKDFLQCFFSDSMKQIRRNFWHQRYRKRVSDE